MKARASSFLLALCLASCETVRVGVSYQGQYANYSAMRTVSGGKPSWDVLVSSDGKRIMPLHR